MPQLNDAVAVGRHLGDDAVVGVVLEVGEALAIAQVAAGDGVSPAVEALGDGWGELANTLGQGDAGDAPLAITASASKVTMQVLEHDSGHAVATSDMDSSRDIWNFLPNIQS